MRPKEHINVYTHNSKINRNGRPGCWISINYSSAAWSTGYVWLQQQWTGMQDGDILGGGGWLNETEIYRTSSNHLNLWKSSLQCFSWLNSIFCHKPFSHRDSAISPQGRLAFTLPCWTKQSRHKATPVSFHAACRCDGTHHDVEICVFFLFWFYFYMFPPITTCKSKNVTSIVRQMLFFKCCDWGPDPPGIVDKVTKFFLTSSHNRHQSITVPVCLSLVFPGGCSVETRIT